MKVFRYWTQSWVRLEKTNLIITHNKAFLLQPSISMVYDSDYTDLKVYFPSIEYNSIFSLDSVLKQLPTILSKKIIYNLDQLPGINK